ncbi:MULTISPECIES: hypothetical protein [unclassified Streptomyces]|uniref:hypothetical protein n=1 Tax=unclassified Streptomyces TaxID=2593676 RepID=UPI000C276949|nr:hypothetical protein [Streptomyces sp. CB02959]PJN36151.1 hypothetical protein CG747_35670 [Streptomyces sp. CB02959]
MVVQDRRGGAVAAAVACGTGLMAGLLATGCSPEGAAADDQAAPKRAAAAVDLRRSAEALVRAGTAKVRTAMETVSGGTLVAIRGTGGYDFAAASGQLRVVLPDLKGKPGGGHQPITEILAPGALFMKNRGAGVPVDKWVRVDTAALSDGNLVTGGATDPLAAAELLRGAREVTFQGEERLGGVVVRHYRGTTDLAAAAGRASARTRPALVAAEKGFTTVVVPFDAYLDDAGRLRKVRERFRFANGAPAGAAVTSTTVLYGFGTEVAVRLPDRRDIFTGKIASASS